MNVDPGSNGTVNLVERAAAREPHVTGWTPVPVPGAAGAAGAAGEPARPGHTVGEAIATVVAVALALYVAAAWFGPAAGR